MSWSREGHPAGGTAARGCAEGMLGAGRASKGLTNGVNSGWLRVNSLHQQHGAASTGDGSYLRLGTGCGRSLCATHTNCLGAGEIRHRLCATPAPCRPPPPVPAAVHHPARTALRSPRTWAMVLQHRQHRSRSSLLVEHGKPSAPQHGVVGECTWGPLSVQRCRALSRNPPYLPRVLLLFLPLPQ